MSETWQPLASLTTDALPRGTATHIVVRTDQDSGTSYRWLPYKRTAGYPWNALGGRWQVATEYGWRNQDLPQAGAWALAKLLVADG